MIPRCQLSPHGPEFSRLAYGTWRLLDDAPTPSAAEIADRLKRCADLGITTIDTAEIYGLYAVEEALGAALTTEPGLRDRLEIVTKAGIDIPSQEKSTARVNHYDATGENLVRCAEKSLQLLGTDRLDLFLVHRPDWLTSPEDTASGLNQLIQSGKVRYAGVSNYSAAQFSALSAFMDQPLVTNQVEISLLHMDALEDGVLDQCQQLQFRPMGWSPLGQGRLFDTSDESAARIQALVEEQLADNYGATLDQLAFAWLMAHPAGIVPILGTNQPERIQAAAAAFEINLERQDWFALWEAAKGHSVP